jgi:hypothetical protein
MSAIKRIEFVSNRMSYIKLRDRWCDIVLNVHAPTEGKIDDTVAYLLKARTLKPAETAVSRQRLCKHVRCYATAFVVCLSLVEVILAHRWQLCVRNCAI